MESSNDKSLKCTMFYGKCLFCLLLVLASILRGESQERNKSELSFVTSIIVLLMSVDIMAWFFLLAVLLKKYCGSS